MARGIEFTAEQLQSFKDKLIEKILGKNLAAASASEIEEAEKKFIADSQAKAKEFSDDILNTASLIDHGDLYTVGTVDILLKTAEVSDTVTFAEVIHGSDPHCSEIMKLQIEELSKNSSKNKLIYPIDLGNGRFSMLAFTKDTANKIQVTYCDPVGLNVPHDKLIPITQEGALEFTTIPSHCVDVISETLGINPTDISITRNEIQPTFFNSEDNNQRYTYGTEAGPLGVDLMIKFAKGEIEVKTENYEGKQLVSDLVKKTENGWSEIKNPTPEEAAQKANQLRSQDYSTVASTYKKYFAEVFPDKVQALETVSQETTPDLENNLSEVSSTNHLESGINNNKSPSSFGGNIFRLFTFAGSLLSVKGSTTNYLRSDGNLAMLNKADTINPLNLPQPLRPTLQPTQQPSIYPTVRPTNPTSQPTSQPTNPTSQPSRQPSGQPSRQPTSQPTGQPTSQPSKQPTSQPTGQPTSQPSKQPTSQPTSKPSMPSSQPTSQPTSNHEEKPENCYDYDLLYLALGGLVTGVALEAVVQGFSDKGSLVNAFAYAWKEGSLGAKICSLTPGMFVTGLGTAIGVGMGHCPKCPAIESGVFSAAAYVSIIGMRQLAECFKNQHDRGGTTQTTAVRVAEYQMTNTNAI